MLITLRQQDKVNSAEQVDAFVSAEIPDKENEPELYDLVGKFMIHGPCGKQNPNEVCMEEGKCTRYFPVKFCDQTSINEKYIQYRCRKDGRTIEVRRNNRMLTADNQFVVPYNPYLLLRYRTHINLLITRSTGCVKYLFKYLFKGADQALLRIVERNREEQTVAVTETVRAQNDAGNNNDRNPTVHYDEVRSFFNGRYMTPPEAAWHILKFWMHKNSHVVYRLAIHLPGTRAVKINETDRPEERNNNSQLSIPNDDEVTETERQGPRVVQVERHSMLTEWFKLNANDANARHYFYREIPKHYVWKFVAGGRSHWIPRQRQQDRIIGRMYNVSPRNRELFHMRVLLLHVKGARSFEEIRTVDGTVYGTFEEACRARNLLADDQEWIRCLDEACRKDMPSVLRKLFAYILVFCQVNNPQELWNRFKRFLMEDFLRRKIAPAEAEQRTLLRIRSILRVHGVAMAQYGLQEPQELPELEDTTRQLASEGLEMVAKLNADQKEIFERVIRAVENDGIEERLFRVIGAAGTGKTFLYNTMLTVLEGRGMNTIAVAWTGLAASLLRGGRTVHSQFQLPIPLFEGSKLRLSRYGTEGQHVIQAKFIVWDEISLTTATAFTLVDTTLRDLCEDQRPFGGKTVVIGGDFKQCLPVVEASDRTMTLKACVKNSDVWHQFVPLQLKINVRVNADEVNFVEWLEQLGRGTLPPFQNRKGRVEIPAGCLAANLESLLHEVFSLSKVDATAMCQSVVLTPLNVSCDVINLRILDKLPGESTVYYSVDEMVSDKAIDEVEAVNYPVEFLNKLTPSGYPPHCLQLKVNATVMLLKNLNVQEGLCNGTRIILRQLGEHVLDGESIGNDGTPTGVRVFIPRVDVVQHTRDLPHQLKRRQFPVKLAYAMTINKAQGQTFGRVGIYLPHPVFDHGQLYVAFSRARSINAVTVFVNNCGPDGRPLPQAQSNHTKNIVFEEVFEDERCEALTPWVQRLPNLHRTNGPIEEFHSPPQEAPKYYGDLVVPIVSENPRRGLVVGLCNPEPKVSCYANATIHSLLQLPEFVDCVSQEASPIARLAWKMCTRRVRDCVELRQTIGGTFAEERQQDCQEFLLALMNELPERFRSLFRYDLRSSMHCPTCVRTVGAPVQVEQIFEHMLYLNMPTERHGVVSFRTLWERPLSDASCTDCTAGLFERFHFEQISRYLIIVLPRYREDGTKNSAIFEDFDPDDCTIAGRRFRTFAVIKHLGETITSGHYVCNIRDEQRRWIECNDSQLSVLPAFDASLKDIYVLFMNVI